MDTTPPTDSDILTRLTPHFPPEMDPAGKSKAVEYFKEIQSKPLEELAILLAIQHRLTEISTSLMERHARREIISNVSKTVYTPGMKRRVL